MRASIFISNLALIFVLSLLPALTWANEPAPPEGGPSKSDKVAQPEEDDFAPSPFTEYGEFNEEEEEAKDTKYFQHGRLFGISLGTGFEGVTGNRGTLWQGGSPMFDLRAHYWFDFNVALDLGFWTAPHFYESKNEGGHWDATLFFVGVHVKYYFDTKNLSSVISFANPYLLAGGGSFTKTESNPSGDSPPSQDTSAGLSLGGGLEFPIKNRKIYFSVEGRLNFVGFKDTYYTKSGLKDLTGLFYNGVAAFLFTW